MDFPRHCHKPNGVYCVVGDQGQYDTLIALGFTDQPEAHVETPMEVSYVDAVKDAAPVQEDKPKGKKGKKDA